MNTEDKDFYIKGTNSQRTGQISKGLSIRFGIFFACFLYDFSRVDISIIPVDKDLAIAYANAYIESDEEVHFIVNLYLRTTTCINKYGNMLFVTCHEYQDKEEHDANILAGGMVLDEFSVDLDTGELG